MDPRRRRRRSPCFAGSRGRGGADLHRSSGQGELRLHRSGRPPPGRRRRSELDDERHPGESAPIHSSTPTPPSSSVSDPTRMSRSISRRWWRFGPASPGGLPERDRRGRPVCASEAAAHRPGRQSSSLGSFRSSSCRPRSARSAMAASRAVSRRRSSSRSRPKQLSLSAPSSICSPTVTEMAVTSSSSRWRTSREACRRSSRSMPSCGPRRITIRAGRRANIRSTPLWHICSRPGCSSTRAPISASTARRPTRNSTPAFRRDFEKAARRQGG